MRHCATFQTFKGKQSSPDPLYAKSVGCGDTCVTNATK